MQRRLEIIEELILQQNQFEEQCKRLQQALIEANKQIRILRRENESLRSRMAMMVASGIVKMYGTIKKKRNFFGCTLMKSM